MAAGAGVRAVAASELRALAADAEPLERRPLDDLGLLALDYTSGTTGRPKGVMYQHRGAYLQSLAMAYHARLRPGSVYLWTLPIFLIAVGVTGLEQLGAPNWVEPVFNGAALVIAVSLTLIGKRIGSARNLAADTRRSGSPTEESQV